MQPLQQVIDNHESAVAPDKKKLSYQKPLVVSLTANTGTRGGKSFQAMEIHSSNSGTSGPS